jgi:hypothetical protein
MRDTILMSAILGFLASVLVMALRLDAKSKFQEGAPMVYMLVAAVAAITFAGNIDPNVITVPESVKALMAVASWVLMIGAGSLFIRYFAAEWHSEMSRRRGF